MRVGRDGPACRLFFVWPLSSGVPQNCVSGASSGERLTSRAGNEARADIREASGTVAGELGLSHFLEKEDLP